MISMHSTKASVVAALLGMVGLLLTMPSTAHGNENGKPGRVPLPAMSTPAGKQCVQPEEVMRRNHMKFILHQRDETMHEGIRTTRYSLKNCVDCHADPKTGSVLGKDGFCESCHKYAAVNIDCFSCHSSSREIEAAKDSSTAPAGMRTLSVNSTQENMANESAKGKKP
jgi:hypothetical protein